MFYYPIDLHYSQTMVVYDCKEQGFYYPIDLHYSQTPVSASKQSMMFYYPIDLHYSQTESQYETEVSGFITL